MPQAYRETWAEGFNQLPAMKHFGARLDLTDSRLVHVTLRKLEEQMGMMTANGYQGRGSPDRVDALVWAIHELVIEPARSWRKPSPRI